MNVKGEAMYLAIGLIKGTRMLLYSVEQSFRSDLRDLSMSLCVTFCGLKLSSLFVHESIWDNITSSVVVFYPTSLSAILWKNSFSADGSACSVLMFGLRIRWITFQISFCFLKKKLFCRIEFSFLWLLFRFCFWTLRSFPSFPLLDFCTLNQSASSFLLVYNVFHTCLSVCLR